MMSSEVGRGAQRSSSTSIFVNDSAYDWGGAIRNIYSSSPTITDCTFTGNSADDGGAMFYYGECKPTIGNCTITRNTAESIGGGIGCTVYSNPTVTNCVLWSNMASEGNQIAVGHPNYSQECILTISYSDVEEGKDNVYVMTSSALNWGTGNIDEDPMFVEHGYWNPNGFWDNGNYHLLPGSPCIDTGNPNHPYDPNETDLDGNGLFLGV